MLLLQVVYLLYRVQCTHGHHTFIEIFAGVKLWGGGPEASYNMLEKLASQSLGSR